MSMSKKNILIIAGLAVGGLGLASLMSDEGVEGDIPQQIKERAGRVLGSQPTATGEQAGATYNIPAQAAVAFPEQEAPFDWGAWLDSQMNGEDVGRTTSYAGLTPEQQRAYNIMAATAAGGGVYSPTKKIPYDPSIVSPTEAPYYAGHDIRAAALGAGAHVGKSGVAMKRSFAGLYRGFLGVGLPATSTQAATKPGVLRPEAVATAGTGMGRSFSGLFADVAKAGTAWKRGISGEPAVTTKKTVSAGGEVKTESKRKIPAGGMRISGYAAPAPTTGAAKKAVLHAKRLRAGRGD